MVDNELDAAAVPPRTRRRWLGALIGVLVLAVIGTDTGWLVYVKTYQPLGDAGIGVTGSMTPRTLKLLTDGIDDTAYAVVGPRGTTGRTQYPLGNNGKYAVRILGLDTGHAPDVTRLQWSGSQDSLHTTRNFPVTVKPGDFIFLVVTVTQPTCNGYTAELDGIPLRYSAFGVHHMWTFPLGPPSVNLPIVLCPPKSALAHVDNGF